MPTDLDATLYVGRGEKRGEKAFDGFSKSNERVLRVPSPESSRVVQHSTLIVFFVFLLDTFSQASLNCKIVTRDLI